MLTFINTQPPQSGDAARNALDMIMMAVSMDQSVQVIFIHDGVWQLIPRHTQAIGQKNPLVKYRILTDVFEMDSLYVCAQSLAQRNLSSEQLEINIQSLETEELSEKLAQSTHIIRF